MRRWNGTTDQERDRMTGVSLAGKAAVVTGAGRGLGRAYAQALAGAGAGVVVNDLDPAAVAETVAAIDGSGGRAVGVVAAVGSSATAQELVDRAVEDFGRLDVMVTNAGILRDRVLWKMSDEDFDLVIETHLRGTFTCARAAAVRMREQSEGGRIIVVGSPAGQYGNFGQTNYSAAKAGIVAFARTWSMELARSEITVNAIVPTAWTQMTATIPVYAPLVGRVEAGRGLPAAVRRDHAVGMPEDCAPLVVFLASEAAAEITGQAIGIGGDRLTLYSHPAEIVFELRDGGWNAQEIARAWSDRFGESAQSSGLQLPELDLEAEAQR
jgi:NAD(P)-dependent dehydrogenase (short-subunit alcohol dehydrogenase family)